MSKHFEPVRDLSSLVEGWELASCNVEPDGRTITMMLIDPAAWASVLNPAAWDVPPYPARIVQATEETEWEYTFQLTHPAHGASSLGRYRLLLWGGLGNPNAFVYDTDGELLHEFWLGDYFEDVQVDSQQRVWVSYFDQGYGKPMSEDGLSCFDSQGVRLTPWWDHFQPFDMYAMNVAKDAIWMHYYTPFPVARLGFDGRLREWFPKVRGARAIVARGSQVALFGGYPPDPYQLTIVQLQGQSARVLSQEPLLLPADREPGQVVGRGGFFHTFHANVWYRFEPDWRA